MLIGIQNSTADYFCFIDDDVELNSLTVCNLVHSASNCISTGYSVEVPANTTWTSNLVGIYRVINCLGFTSENVNYCWGGCFCLSATMFKNLKIQEFWEDGGYTDDVLVGNAAKQQKIKIKAPAQCMFQNRIQLTNFSRQYWNYVQR